MIPSLVTGLETVWVDVPEDALDAYEAALATACRTVGFFFADEDARIWRVEGVKEAGVNESALSAGLALAALVTGVEAPLQRSATEVGGWLARTLSTFPEQLVGRRFAVRGTHLTDRTAPGRIALLLDAGVAFGSGEHGSTRGCLRALERVAYRRPARILDLGCGSGILAMAAAQLLHRKALATDIDHWSVRVARENTRLNHLASRVRCEQAVGWQPAARIGTPYDLVFANILARPLCKMAPMLATNLAPGGTAILAGLLKQQLRMVLGAHRSLGLVLDFTLQEGNWTTLVLRRPHG